MERTNIPMPPSQWRNDLQNRIAWDCASTSIRTVAPVVVRPDMVSKTASAGVLKLPAKINGKAPNKAHAVHPSVVMAMPSRLPMRRLSLGADRSTPVTPAAAVIADERRNAAQSPSPNMSDIAAGASIKAPNTTTMRETEPITDRMFNAYASLSARTGELSLLLPIPMRRRLRDRRGVLRCRRGAR